MMLTTSHSLMRLSRVTDTKFAGSGDEKRESAVMVTPNVSGESDICAQNSSPANLVRVRWVFALPRFSAAMDERTKLRADFEQLQREYKNMEAMRKVN